MFQYLKAVHTRACLKKAFCKMCATICERFRPDEGAVAGYVNRIRVKYTAKWGVQIAGMIFQTRSGFRINTARFRKVSEIGFLINPKRGCHFPAVPFCLFLLISVNFFLYLLISVYSSVSSSVTSTTVSRSSGSG